MAETLHFDPFDYAFHEDPYPVYRALREQAPAYHNEELGFWALSRHADVLAGFKDTARFSNAAGIALEIGDLSGDMRAVLSILGMDPPEHGRMRGLVSRGFTPRRVAALEPRIRELAQGYLRRFRAAGRCEFIGDFAGRMPMDVVSEMFGVPECERGELRALVDCLVHREPGVRGIPPAGIEASSKLLRYFAELVAARRRRPGADLASALLQVELDGDRLAERDIIAFCYLMIIAGNETTTKLLANCLYWLGKNPAQRREVQRNPARIPDWIEETLRYDNSTQLMARVLTCDVEMHGRRIPKGARLLLLIGAANRDERAFPDPDRYDLSRDTGEHLSFGRGAHFCLGAALARLEARVALEEWQRAIPGWRVCEDALQRVHSTNVRGFSRFPVEWQPR